MLQGEEHNIDVSFNREKEATLEDLLNAKKLIIDMQGREKILKEQL